jgi:hypothetical protein
VAIAILPLTTAIGMTLIAAVIIGTLLEPGIGLIHHVDRGPVGSMDEHLHSRLAADRCRADHGGIYIGDMGAGRSGAARVCHPDRPCWSLGLFVGWAAITMLWAPDLIPSGLK